MRETLLLLITVKWAQSIVDMGLKPHVKSEITLLELHDPEIPKTSSHSANGFGFPGEINKIDKKLSLLKTLFQGLVITFQLESIKAVVDY